MQSGAKKGSASCRDAEATKGRILDAAEDEFARTGLLGARTESIAAKTGVTKAMIHYYFKDKETLYQAVLERLMARRIQNMQSLDIHSADAEQALRSFLEAFLADVAVTRNMSSIFMFEALQNKGRFYGQVTNASLYGPLVAIIKRGVESGHFRQVDPLHIAVNIVGMCVFYYCSYENLKHLWPPDADPLSDTMKEKHKKEAIELTLNGLRPSNSVG